MTSVDVAVPCYQYGRFLRDCVTSVLSQDFGEIRVLIIDNASSDNSLEVARQLAAEDRRVQVVAHRANVGHHASFNEGIDWASSDYFTVLCADDLLTPGCLSRAISVMDQHSNVNLFYGRTFWLRGDDPVPCIEPSARDATLQVLSGREFLAGICRAGGRHDVSMPSVVVRTSAQKQVGYFRANLQHTDDLEMWMRFACTGDVARIDAVQGIGRVHSMARTAGLSDTLKWDLNREAAFESFFANEGASAPPAKGLYRTARRSLAERAYWGALAALARGDARLSSSLLRFAFTRNPTTMVVPPFGYLYRRGNTFGHSARVLSEAARRLGRSIGGGDGIR